MDHFSDIVKVALCLLVLAPYLVDLLIFLLELLLLAAEVLPQIDLNVLFCLQFLLEQELLPSSLFQLCF